MGYREQVTTAGVNSSTFEWDGGPGTFLASGAFGGATIDLQWTPDGGTTWVAVNLETDDATAITLAAAGSKRFNFPRCQMRFHLSVVGAGAAIDAVAAKRMISSQS